VALNGPESTRGRPDGDGPAVSGGRRPPIRAVTLGVASPHPLGPSEIEGAARDLASARAAFERAGYEVQTLRLSTRPVLGDLDGWGHDDLVGYAGKLQGALDDAGVAFCSLGPAMPSDGPEGVAALAEMLVGRPALNASALVAPADGGLDDYAARSAAQAMLTLAQRTEQGLGNFNFAALACVVPGTPFFPAAYHDGPSSIAIALQGAGTVADALAGGAERGEVETRVRERLRAVAAPVVALARELCGDLGTFFGGIDLSPAPDLDDSIAAAIELAGHGPLGGPGTLSLAAAVTAGVRSSGLPRCGYSGLMLPVMEDPVLARRWEEGRVGIDQLLTWSAVCGTGLDTVPVPGDVRQEDLAALICDVGALAARLRKPLSARILPVPGKRAGERSDFDSPYLVNTLIKALASPS
jgi:uncharacterized protein (UPF0210 family)